MVSLFTYLFLFVLTAAFQAGVASHIGIMDIKPDFFLILVVIAALRHGPLAGAVIGFFAGLSYDVYAPVEWLGANSLAFTVIGFVMGQLEENFLNLHFLPKAFLLAFACLVKDIIYFFAMGKAAGDLPYLLLRQTLPEALYTMLFAVIVFFLLDSRGTARRYGHEV
jgi:rod shape-determining protein MreD